MAKVADAAAQQLTATAAGSAATGTGNAVQQESSAETRTVGLVYDKAMEYHVREDHPEHPDRVRVLNERLAKAGLVDRCIKLPSKLATDEELLTCHSQEHITKVSRLYNSAPDMRTEEGELLQRIGDTFIITGDIYCNMHTDIAARSAAGCAVQAVEAVLSGQVDSAFAIVRPPGHHAEPSDYMGFCFFNNVAVAAHAALKHPDIQRVLILDWDVHHGNGTQKVFWEDDRVLFVSLHRRDKDFYPEGIGFATEVGEGAGRGYNVNVPWFETKMGDGDYMAAFELILEPIISDFDPQLVIISAGFDAAEGDFLGKCLVTPEGFSAMTAALMRHAGGKVVAVLEGGYVPSILGECAAAVLSCLLGDPAPSLHASVLGAVRSKTCATLANVDEQQRQFWARLAAQPPFESAFKLYKAQHQLAALCIGGSGKPSSGRMVTRRQGAGTTGKAGSQETDAGCVSAVPLAARAPRLSSASAAAKKSKAAAAAAADGVPMASPARTPTAAAAKRGGKGSLKAGTPAAAGFQLPVSAAAAAAGADQLQPAASALLEATSASAPAASIPRPAAAAAPAPAPAGRKIRIKLAGKAATADALQLAPADATVAVAGAGINLSPAEEADVPTEAAAAAVVPPLAATLGPQQPLPEPATLTNLATPVPSTGRKGRTAATPAAAAAAAEGLPPAAAMSRVASGAGAAVTMATPPSRMTTTPVTSSSMPETAAAAAASAGPTSTPAAAAAAAAAAGEAAGSAHAGLPGTPAPLASLAAGQQAAAQASPALPEPALPDPHIVQEAAASWHGVPAPAAEAPAAAAGPMPADMVMGDVPPPGTPAEYDAAQWHVAPAAVAAGAAAASAAAVGDEVDGWAATGSAQLKPPMQPGAGLVDSLTADLLRLAVQEAAGIPLSP